jgi:hypothetical protein
MIDALTQSENKNHLSRRNNLILKQFYGKRCWITN